MTAPAPVTAPAAAPLPEPPAPGASHAEWVAYHAARFPALAEERKARLREMLAPGGVPWHLRQEPEAGAA